MRRDMARVAPTEGYKRCGEVRYPPVTASPCQPPLGKGAMGTGGRIAKPVTSVTGFAMTHCKECVGRADVGIGPYEVFTDRIS